MSENDISFKIRGAIFNVYNKLGPGLLESVYESALAYELIKEGLKIERQVSLPIVYDGTELGAGFRIDILVEKLVLIEIKSVDTLADIHHKQTLTYVRLSGLRLGVLVNFNTANILSSRYRKVNQL